MDYIRVTRENIDKEHICCAMSGKQSLAKKEWLKQRFEEGLVFYRSAERGKCFIEYIPAENAWVPIEADGYLYINCLWVSGSMMPPQAYISKQILFSLQAICHHRLRRRFYRDNKGYILPS